MARETIGESRFVSKCQPAEGGCADRAAPSAPRRGACDPRPAACPERSAALDSRNCSPPLAARGAAFLDRDGVLNDQTAFVNKPEDFNLLPGAAAAVARLNRAGIPVVVITNQGGIALGYLTEDTLAAIHERMTTLLAAEGAHVDAVFYCPHLPPSFADRQVPPMPAEGKDTTERTAFGPRRCTTDAAPTVPHMPNAITRYVKDCQDRKPGTGMLERAHEDLGIDLRKSVLVGDATTDILAGIRAGCHTILVRTGYAGRDAKAVAEPDHVAADLSEAVSIILDEFIPAATSSGPSKAT
jgi:histidinol-phosphate phosphatase family protein